MQPVRKKNREISRQESLELLAAGEYGVLSTVGADDQPYGVPLNYVLQDSCIYFHCALVGHKLENIAAAAKVSFCVVGRTRILAEEFSTAYESVVAFGVAKPVEGAERIEALTLLLEKYCPEHLETGKQYIAAENRATRVIKIEIDHLSGKARKQF